MRVLLVKAMADSHLYSHYVASLQKALSELGHEAVVTDQSIHVANGAAPANFLLEELQASHFDALLSFSSFFGGVALNDGRAMFDALGVKFIGWQLDHPIYAPQSLMPVLKGRYAVYSNPNHLRYAQAVKLPGRGMIMLPGGEAPGTDGKPYQSRSHGLVIAATWNGEPQRFWENEPDSLGKSLLIAFVDQILEDKDVSVLDAFNAAARKLGLDARLGEDPAFDAQMRDFLCAPLTYVRHVDRVRVIRALAEAGLPITLCGDGWQGHIGDRPNVTYRGRVEFQDLVALYGDAKVVLNLNAGNGACERAIDAALAGAAVASDHSQSLSDLFGADGIGVYNRAKPQTAAAVVGRLLESRDGERVAERGRARVLSAGLWRHRAEQLVDFVSRS